MRTRRTLRNVREIHLPVRASRARRSGSISKQTNEAGPTRATTPRNKLDRLPCGCSLISRQEKPQHLSMRRSRVFEEAIVAKILVIDDEPNV